jgi:cell division control protein 6
MSNQSPFDTTQDIFRNRDVLDVDDYQPEELIERDEQIDEYASALEPILSGWKPNNIFVYGKTGTGKTATTHYMLNWLRHDIQDQSSTTGDGNGEGSNTPSITNLEVIYLNCEALTSSYQVAVELLNDLREESDQVATRGHAPNDIYNWLFEEIDNRDSVVLIVLDEVDHIGDDDSILYQLARAESTNNLERSHLGLIGISNDFSFRDDLSPKVRDSLCEKEILFPAYNATELTEILKRRAEKALYDDAYEMGVMNSSAAYAAKDKGSARQAIDILRNAGDLARKKDLDTITPDLVKEAKGIVERGRVSEMIEGLSPHGKYALHALAIANRDGGTPIRTKELYDYYRVVCQREQTDTLSVRALRDHLAELDLIGIAKENQQNAGRAGGKYKQFDLDVKVDAVIDAFENDTDVHHSMDDSFQTTL